MRRWFLQLSDPDPKLRDQAKTDLMGLSTQDLPKLRQIAGDNAPLLPEVISALHEIVVQVFLASDPYQSSSGAMQDASGTDGPYFLGILWQEKTNEMRLGAWVDRRLPGFPSYRFLREGDMIMGIILDPQVPLAQIPNSEVHNIDDLRTGVAGLLHKQNIALQVLRNGEVIQISVKMAPRPLIADPPNVQQNMPMQGNVKMIDDFAADRARDADDYWHLNFDAVIEPHSETTASNPLE